MDKFSKTFMITYREVDSRDIMKLNTVVDFMQDMARIHATKLGLAYATEDSPYYWIITRMQVVLDEYPHLYDEIRMETYIEGLDGLFSVRRFNIYNKSDILIGHIQGYYLLIEKSTRYPVRIKSIDGDLTTYNYTYQGDKLGKLRPNIAEVKQNLTRRVYSGEIDTNNHMNNAHYVRWSLDMYSTAELLAKPIKAIHVQFMKEMLEGDEINLELGVDSIGCSYVIGRNKDSNEIHYISKIRY